MLALMALQQREDRSPTHFSSTVVQSIGGGKLTIPVQDAKATVLIFLLTDCPIANRYAPEIARIEKEYEEKGVRFFRVYVYQDATVDEIIEHAKEYGYRSPAIHDVRRTLVAAVGATVTPEVAVVLQSGDIAYRGRIDDMYVEHGRLRETEFRRDLRIALDEITSGRPVAVPRTAALGCFIE